MTKLPRMLDVPVAFPLPANEPILSYAPGTKERTTLKAELQKLSSETPDIPHVIGGKAIVDGKAFDVRAPHAHAKLIATAHDASPALTQQAITAAKRAAGDWAAMSFED